MKEIGNKSIWKSQGNNINPQKMMVKMSSSSTHDFITFSFHFFILELGLDLVGNPQIKKKEKKKKLNFYIHTYTYFFSYFANLHMNCPLLHCKGAPK